MCGASVPVLWLCREMGSQGQGSQAGCVFETEYSGGGACFPPPHPVVTYNPMVLLHSISSLSSHFRVCINIFLSTYCMPSTND